MTDATKDEVAARLDDPALTILDVRSPAEFGGELGALCCARQGHLPGAVNVTMRKLTTTELEAALSALPKRPVIAPCYDRRSSFFALTLGLRLHRLGYEYLGRYTVPHEFSLGCKDKPHVAAFKAAHTKKDLLTLAAEPLTGVFESQSAATEWCEIPGTAAAATSSAAPATQLKSLVRIGLILLPMNSVSVSTA